jgi:hypothetical protein
MTAPTLIVAPSARLEHATYCSASKRSNPLSYEGKQAGILTRLDTKVKAKTLKISQVRHVSHENNPKMDACLRRSHR